MAFGIEEGVSGLIFTIVEKILSFSFFFFSLNFWVRNIFYIGSPKKSQKLVRGFGFVVYID